MSSVEVADKAWEIREEFDRKFIELEEQVNDELSKQCVGRQVKFSFRQKNDILSGEIVEARRYGNGIEFTVSQSDGVTRTITPAEIYFAAYLIAHRDRKVS